MRPARCCWTVLLLAVLFLADGKADSAWAAAEWPSLEDWIDDEAGALPTAEIERILAGFDRDVQDLVPPFNLREAVRGPGGWELDALEIAQRLGRHLIRELILGGRLLAQLMVAALLGALLQGLAPEKGGAREVAAAVTLLFILWLALQGFRSGAELTGRTVDEMAAFLQAMLPLLITLTASAGAVTSAGIFHPLILGVVNLSAALVHAVILPLSYAAVVVGVAGCVGARFPVGRLSRLFRQTSLTLLGLVFIVFMGVMSVRGVMAPIADGLALKTARFLTGSFVPVIGGRLADALGVVAGGSLLIRNAAGAFAMLVVFAVTAFPALKLLAVLTVYRIAGALVEPVADKPVSEALSVIADGFALLLASLVTVALMFFVGLTILVGAGNLTAVMRG